MNENSDLKITQTLIGKGNKIAILVLNGYIDSNTANILKEKLLFLGSKINRFILDFAKVDYVSSAGWGVVLSRIRENRQKGGDIVFVNMIKEVYSIYDLLELHKVIKHFTNVEDGLEYYGEKIPSKAVELQKPEAAKVTYRESMKKLTLEQAIYSVIRKNPLLNSSQIKRILELPQYGFTKLSTLKVYFKLRSMGLNTKVKKLYFAWQEEKKLRNL
jgi:anti-anti-sigma factor